MRIVFENQIVDEDGTFVPMSLTRFQPIIKNNLLSQMDPKENIEKLAESNSLIIALWDLDTKPLPYVHWLTICGNTIIPYVPMRPPRGEFHRYRLDVLKAINANSCSFDLVHTYQTQFKQNLGNRQSPWLTRPVTIKTLPSSKLNRSSEPIRMVESGLITRIAQVSNTSTDGLGWQRMDTHPPIIYKSGSVAPTGGRRGGSKKKTSTNNNDIDIFFHEHVAFGFLFPPRRKNYNTAGKARNQIKSRHVSINIFGSPNQNIRGV